MKPRHYRDVCQKTCDEINRLNGTLSKLEGSGLPSGFIQISACKLGKAVFEVAEDGKLHQISYHHLTYWDLYPDLFQLLKEARKKAGIYNTDSKD